MLKFLNWLWDHDVFSIIWQLLIKILLLNREKWTSTFGQRPSPLVCICQRLVELPLPLLCADIPYVWLPYYYFHFYFWKEGYKKSYVWYLTFASVKLNYWSTRVILSIFTSRHKLKNRLFSSMLKKRRTYFSFRSFYLVPVKNVYDIKAGQKSSRSTLLSRHGYHTSSPLETSIGWTSVKPKFQQIIKMSKKMCCKDKYQENWTLFFQPK